MITTQEIKCTNTTILSKVSLKTLSRVMSIPTEEYGEFVFSICFAAGLIHPNGDNKFEITPTAEEWLNLPRVKQEIHVINSFLSNLCWTEFDEDHMIYSLREAAGSEITEDRMAILKLLAEKGEQWFEINSIRDCWLYNYPSRVGSRGESYASLAIDTLFTKSAYWTGLTEIVVAKAGGVDTRSALNQDVGCSKLTAAGLALIDKQHTLPPYEAEESNFMLLANGDIYLSPLLSRHILYRTLLTASLPAKGDAGNVVRVSPASLRAGLDAGLTPEDILTFFKNHSRTGIPQNIEYMINELGGKYGNIRVGVAQMYLKTSTKQLLDELMARKELKPLVIKRLDDLVVVLNDDDPEKLIKALRKGGYAPVLDKPEAKIATLSPTEQTKKSSKADFDDEPGFKRIKVERAKLKQTVRKLMLDETEVVITWVDEGGELEFHGWVENINGDEIEMVDEAETTVTIALKEITAIREVMYED